MDNINILVDLEVGGSESTRENITIALLNQIKSNRDKTVWDISDVDGAKATMRALDDNDNKVNTRGKSKAKMILRVLESERENLTRGS